jgi:hypothetical protein
MSSSTLPASRQPCRDTPLPYHALCWFEPNGGATPEADCSSMAAQPRPRLLLPHWPRPPRPGVPPSAELDPCTGYCPRYGKERLAIGSTPWHTGEGQTLQQQIHESFSHPWLCTRGRYTQGLQLGGTRKQGGCCARAFAWARRMQWWREHSCHASWPGPDCASWARWP